MSTSLQVHSDLPLHRGLEMAWLADPTHSFPLCLGRGSQITSLSSEQWFSNYSTGTLGVS